MAARMFICQIISQVLGELFTVTYDFTVYREMKLEVAGYPPPIKVIIVASTYLRGDYKPECFLHSCKVVAVTSPTANNTQQTQQRLREALWRR